MIKKPQRGIWVPEVILEEDEDVQDDSVFPSPVSAVATFPPSPSPTQIQLFTSPSPPIQPAVSPAPPQLQPVSSAKKMVQLEVPLRRTRRGDQRRRRKRSRSMRRLVRTIKFMKKWAKAKDPDPSNSDETKYDKFLKKGHKRVGKRIIYVPPEDNFFVAWFKRNFPLDPSETFVFWYVV